MNWRKKRFWFKLIITSLAISVIVSAGIVGNFFLRLTKITPTADSAFRWAYYLYTPTSIENNRNDGEIIHLLILPNNTGHSDNDLKVHDRSAVMTTFLGQLIFGDLNVAILVPVFPRPEEHGEVYTQALDRDCLTTNVQDLHRLDLQLEAMIDDATNRLSQQGWRVDRKVLLMGFSASGMFVNRFVLLHPERVLAAAVGSPGGWPIVPVKTWGEQNLRYPIGVSDLFELTRTGFDLETFKAIPLLFFMGDRDTNDSVPYTDSYDEEDRKLIFELFGATLVERWRQAQAIYTSVGANADFRLYSGVGHMITLQELADIHDFFVRVLKDPQP